MSPDPIVIASYARTPIGGFQGSLAAVKATALGATAIRAAAQRAARSGSAFSVERVYMGCVLPAGLGQAPARQAALGAGLSAATQATTVNKMCGSGMQATILACEALASGGADIVVAGGMESMTNAPYLLAKHRGGARMGHDVAKDSMFLDGLEDAYEEGAPLMGVFAEMAARRYDISRKEQDAYAMESVVRASAAIATGAFDDELVPVEVATRAGGDRVSIDEQPGKAKLDMIPRLKPVFLKDGTVTAASSSSISDGAAALVLTRRSVADKLGLQAVAYVRATACHAHETSWYTTAPAPAMKKALAQADWSVSDVDLFEVNEAFAVVALVAMRDLGIPHAKLNVHGGACALGHPIGASGARILVTLLAALKRHGGKRGVAGICLGGGEATAMALELV